MRVSRLILFFYPCVLLKGNNETNSWSNATAKDDASQVFESDLIFALGHSEEVRDRYYEPVLTALIQNVVNKWKTAQITNSSYTYLQLQDDLENIKEIAQTQYGINDSGDFIAQILTFVEGQIPPTPPKPKTVFYIPVGNDIGNWWYVFGWCFLPFFAYMLFLLFRFLNNRFHLRDLKFVYGVITGGLISPFFTSLFTNAPYDYQVESLETGIIILVIVIGVLSVYTIKKYSNRLKFKQGRFAQVYHD